MLVFNEEGYRRLEEVSFDANNESGCPIETVGRYRSCMGHYPECVLADHHRMLKWIRNGNIRITRTGLKWNDIFAEANTLWSGMYRNQVGRNASGIHRIIRIRVESV